MMSTVSDHMMNRLMRTERIRLRLTTLDRILNQPDVHKRIRRTCFKTTNRCSIALLKSAVAGALAMGQRPTLPLCFEEGETLLDRALLLGGGRRHWKRDCARRGRGRPQKQRVAVLVEVRRAGEDIRNPKLRATVAPLHALQSVLAGLEASAGWLPLPRLLLDFCGEHSVHAPLCPSAAPR